MNVYNEKQKFNSIWGYIIFAATSILNYFYISRFNDANNVIIISTIIAALMILLLFEFCALYTKIDDKNISYKFFPFHKKFKQVDKNIIDHLELIHFKPIKDYGGWGIRRSLKEGKAFTTKGNIGLKIKTKSGESFLIGTQKSEELYQFLSNKKYSINYAIQN